MSLETFVVSGVPELSRALDGSRWWAAIERNAPRALVPVANAMRAAAPKGKTGKLSRGFDLRTKRVSQGFIQGVEVEIVERVPYGHLVESGHQIIARGPGRKGLSPATLAEKGPRGRLMRGRRAQLRRALLARRAAGAIGFVPGRFFGRDTLRSMEAQTMSLLERLVRQELLR